MLARLLAPSDFGLYGIALLSLSALETFSQTGFTQALIQKKEDTKLYLDTAWTFQVIRGLVLAIILVLGAPLMGAFFGEPRAVLLVRVLGAAVFLKSLGNIGIVYFRKELKFHKQFVYEFSGTFADLAVAIPAAFILRSVWALVFGLLAGNLARTVISYFVHSYRPRLGFSQEQFKELFAFGRWILGSTIVVFLATQGDDIFLGKVLGVTALGFYQMAFRFANLPGSEFGVLSRVAFPAYSKLQDNIPKLKTAYLKMVRFVTFLAIPLAGGIFMLGPQFTQIFLGDKWMPIVPALRILVISAMVRVTIGTGGALFNARGRPDIDFKMNLARVITLAITIYPLTVLWKISGTSLAVFLAVCAGIPIWLIGSKREAKVEVRDHLKILWPPLIGTAIMSVVISILGIALDQLQLIGFLVSAFVGVITFLGFTFLVRNVADYAMFKDIKFIFNSLGEGGGEGLEEENS